MPKDLHELPKIRDSLSYLYIEHAKVEQDGKSIAFYDKSGKTLVPIATVSVLMLGPGTSITHEAVKTIVENGCLILWCGEEGVRLYAQGFGETRKAKRLLHQAKLASDPASRLSVVKKMYVMRFQGSMVTEEMDIEELRGREGVRVRTAYYEASKQYNVPWHGRTYDRGSWTSGDTVNRALSAANSCLYGIAHAAIVSAGYSPGIGFVHTGKQLSFVYDIADLYKVDTSIPVAFEAASKSEKDFERQIRLRMRDIFREQKLLSRIVSDIDSILFIPVGEEAESEGDFDDDAALPGLIWDGKG